MKDLSERTPRKPAESSDYLRGVEDSRRATLDEVYAAILAEWRCPHDTPKAQADCYWQAHGEGIVRDLRERIGDES